MGKVTRILANVHLVSPTALQLSTAAYARQKRQVHSSNDSALICT